MASYLVKFKEQGGQKPAFRGALCRRRSQRRIKAIAMSEQGEELVFHGSDGRVVSLRREQVEEVWLIP